MSQSLQSILKERRSANNFLPDVVIPASEFDEIFKLVKLAPSAFNLQHTHYVVITDKEQKEQIKAAAFYQHKVTTSSAVIVVLGDKLAYQQAEKIYRGFLDLGIMDQPSFDSTIQSIYAMYQGRGEDFQKEEAIRNASLSAMQLMLVAKDRGWDTCPMIGFDPDALHKVVNIPDQYIPVMLITIGKEDTNNRRPRGYRKPNGEFVTHGFFS
ncbi:nitroreductase family protein [Brevibacillus dissolubilis]|uniref:nitroreductase family protein n=1 Tax=Brevibacillus dissolubilis TaxID=1844116 RepID=UPI001115C6EA|nr:nitroreductase family protein [Brevibacillus dissolubilis]